jgi:hypothetical protein
MRVWGAEPVAGHGVGHGQDLARHVLGGVLDDLGMGICSYVGVLVDVRFGVSKAVYEVSINWIGKTLSSEMASILRELYTLRTFTPVRIKVLSSLLLSACPIGIRHKSTCGTRHLRRPYLPPSQRVTCSGYPITTPYRRQLHVASNRRDEQLPNSRRLKPARVSATSHA